MGNIELLAPAGSMDKLKMAFLYGADAVYLGGKSFGLRAFSDNFSNEELKEAVDYAHALGKRIHVTVNIFPHNEDLEGLPEYLIYLRDIGVDAVLIADPGIFALARQLVPDLPIHISDPGQYDQLGFGKILGRQWGDASRHGPRSQPGRRQDHSRKSAGCRTRRLRPRCHVHFLFRPLPAEQLLYPGRPRFQPRRMRPVLPL